MSSLKQRSNEWYEMRRGRFTASEIHLLLSKQGLGKTGESYCFKKAVEAVFGIEEDSFVSYDMLRGIELEPFAFRKFQELMYLEFIDVQEALFFPYGDDAGASPDGLVGCDEILEIKCPKRDKFFSIVAKGVDEIDPVYISQMQMQMMCTNSVRANFFNYGIFDGKEYWHHLVIERDEKIIDLIKQRLPEAVAIRDKYVKQLIKNKQF